MRIAHVIRRISFADWGGTEQVVWNLAKAQAAEGHEVRIFATDALCKVPREERDGLEIRRFPCIYPWWPMPKGVVDALDRKGGNPFVPGLGKALREWKPEIIHCHAMARIAELCIRTAKGMGAKCVVSLHGGAAHVPAAEAASLRAPTRRRLPWGKLLEVALGWKRRVPEGADGIICVGEDEAEYWRGRHLRVLWLPNGVDTALFGRGKGQEPMASDSSRLQPGPDGKAAPFRVLCVARIDRQKDQMALVEALGRNPRMRLRLVGPVTQPDYMEELLARAKELGVEGRLETPGPLEAGSPELAEEYGKSDVFALASRHEPFGITVLEAWAAGIPVAASSAGGMGRLLAAHPGAALSFEPGDAAGLDAALSRLERDMDLRRSLVAEGWKASEGYGWVRLAERLVDFYGELR